jgi:ABC-2 type transport system permease protein
VGAGLAVSAPLAVQVAYLARRSVVRTLRQPANLVFPLLFPLTLLAVNSAGLDPATEIPGFPVASYLDFALAVPFLQGALLASNGAGTDLARDIETGFLSRLSLTPMHPMALLAGQLAGAVTIGVLSAGSYLTVGVLAGVSISAGVGGAAVIVVLAALIALGFGALGAFLALRTGSGEAVQGLFPLMFVLLFISSAFLPRPLIATDWFRTIATWNPVSYLVEGLRSLIITGWDAEALALGFGVATAVAVVALTAATAALRTRMVRT